jgi:peroxiredoxin
MVVCGGMRNKNFVSNTSNSLLFLSGEFFIYIVSLCAEKIKKGISNNMKLSSAIKNKCIKTFYTVIVVWIFFPLNIIHAQGNNDSVFDAAIIANFQLQDAAVNKTIFLKVGENESQKLLLFIFLSPECPLCKNYSNTLNSLYHQLSRQVCFYGIIPGKAYSADEVKKFKEQYNISFQLLIDHDEKLTKYLQAVVTPQVLLLNNDFQLLYKGAIDNWLQALGKQRVKPTEFFLQNVIQQSLSNETILIKRTKAVGCRINDY